MQSWQKSAVSAKNGQKSQKWLYRLKTAVSLRKCSNSYIETAVLAKNSRVCQKWQYMLKKVTAKPLL
jgi:hypothetical protein